MRKKTTNNYLKIIDQISSARKKNNVNWMKLLKLAIRHAPVETSKIMKEINSSDKKISNLFKKIEKINLKK